MNAQGIIKINTVLTLIILSSSTDASSLGIEDTPVSLLANTLSDPATDDVNVALLSGSIKPWI